MVTSFNIQSLDYMKSVQILLNILNCFKIYIKKTNYHEMNVMSGHNTQKLMYSFNTLDEIYTM